MVDQALIPEHFEAADPHEPGLVPYTYWSLKAGHLEAVNGGVIEETLITLHVNGQELATLMCSPTDEEALALGFLYNEGVIHALDDVHLLEMNRYRTAVDLFLKQPQFSPPRRMILTSGCGGGVTFQTLAETYPPLATGFATTPDVLFRRMHDLQGAARLYQQVRGVHTSILGDDEKLLVVAEDVGRHNSVDKIAGKALLAGIPMQDRILLSSGRISSEMLSKARQMGVPVVASRTAPTSITVRLAQAWNICVVGYLNPNGMRVYTHAQRLGLREISGEPAPGLS
jgi:FdhD protein